MAGIKIVTAPTWEPVVISQAKLHLRIEDTTHDDDEMLTWQIKAAREHVERRTNRQLCTATWDLYLDEFPDEIEMPYPPLASVTSIKYLDDNGVEQTLAASVYSVDTGIEPGVIRLAYDQSWPSFRSVENAITVRFVAGWASLGAVPSSLRAAVLLKMSELYTHREIQMIGTISEDLPAFESLIWSYKVPVLR